MRQPVAGIHHPEFHLLQQGLSKAGGLSLQIRNANLGSDDRLRAIYLAAQCSLDRMGSIAEDLVRAVEEGQK